jgi:enoyl-[acyl-carrier protein] reductase/trans-2-enoyl-CoA reductase (NAD+)
LEETARGLNTKPAGSHGGRAVTSVNGAAVTQSSTAIPGIALYIGLLRAVMSDAMQTPINQLTELWDQLAGTKPMKVDDHGRIRLDSWELADNAQAAVTARWMAAGSEKLPILPTSTGPQRNASTVWFCRARRRL